MSPEKNSISRGNTSEALIEPVGPEEFTDGYTAQIQAPNRIERGSVVGVASARQIAGSACVMLRISMVKRGSLPL